MDEQGTKKKIGSDHELVFFSDLVPQQMLHARTSVSLDEHCTVAIPNVVPAAFVLEVDARKLNDARLNQRQVQSFLCQHNRKRNEYILPVQNAP